MSNKEMLEQWEAKERERRLRQDCDNPQYLGNLILALKKAKREKNIELIIAYARELENAKILCGASPMIEAFEHQLRDVSTEFDLLNNPIIQRSLAPAPKEKLCPFCTKCAERMFTMEDFQILELHKDGTRSLVLPKEKTVKIPKMLTDAQIALRNLTSKNYEEEHRKQLFPEICSDQCPHVQCGYRREENFGKPCEKQQSQYKTPPSQFSKKARIVRRTLNPNEPDYRSPQFREEKTEKPKKLGIKESLNPM